MYKTICILAVGIGIGAVLVQWFTQGTFSGIFPILAILICPLMMIFMMQGMHNSGHKDSEQSQ